MKINSIQRDITLKYSSGLSSESPKFREKNGTGMYENANKNNTGYCGSFTGKSEAATSFLDKILKSNWFGKFAKYAEEHNIAGSALIALVLAGVMRPATIMALPGDKDKGDKIYASGHAMASGIMGFMVSAAITSPFDESIKKVFEAEDKKFIGPKLQKINEKIAEFKNKINNGTITDAEKTSYKLLKAKKNAMKTLSKNIPDWFIAVPRAMLTIALIPPILKYVFGVEKKKKAEPNQSEIKTADINFVEKPVFSAFKGGVQ